MVGCTSVIPPVVVGAVDLFFLSRPLAAHLIHAVPPLAAASTGGAAVPGPAHWPMTTRFQVAVGEWLFGLQPSAWPVSIALLACFVALCLPHRQRANTVLGFVTAALVLHLHDLWTYLAAPAFVAGLFRLSPVLLFALLPTACGQRSSSVRRWSLAISGIYLLVVLGTINIDGGPQFGPRLLLPIFPFVAFAAWEGLASYRQSPTVGEQLVWRLGVVLACGSLAMQTAVAGRSYYELNSTEREPVAWILAATEPVIVVDSAFTMSVAIHVFEGRSVVAAASQEAATRLARVMADRHVEAFAFVARERTPDPEFPGFVVSSVQATRFTRIVHWTARARRDAAGHVPAGED